LASEEHPQQREHQRPPEGAHGHWEAHLEGADPARDRGVIETEALGGRGESCGSRHGQQDEKATIKAIIAGYDQQVGGK